MLTIIKGLSVREALSDICGTRIEIKWPNDIIYDGRKLCGTLTEMSTDREGIRYVVVGTGINVHNRKFPEELADRAVSVRMITGRDIPRPEILEKINEVFERKYEDFMRIGNLESFVGEYNEYMAGMNTSISAVGPGHRETGIARGINPEGKLRLQTPRGELLIGSGEISIDGVYGGKQNASDA